MNFFSKRSSGVLLHLSSLPGQHPIGGLGSDSFNFIDYLKSCGQSWWQFLPLGPTSPTFGNSPYMVSSTHAGNPLFIDPEQTIQLGLAAPNNIPKTSFSEYSVDFPAAKKFKETFLRQAWQYSKTSDFTKTLQEFSQKHEWLDDYALFMVLKQKFEQKPWFKWPKKFRFPSQALLKKYQKELAEEIQYFQFEQFLFFQQWELLHKHAQKCSIKLIGDLPIYVAADSVDVWANQEIFELNPKTGSPTHVAGVPPDYFSKTGQRWGNPLYRWNSRNTRVRTQLYKWWEKRLSSLFSLVDMIRIDHFRGFESYWSVPAHKETAIEGKWKKGPGLKFFTAMEQRLGVIPIIAEDLGIITPEVEKLRDDLGYPGMKILQFAFDNNPDNAYLPHNHIKNSIAYTGTHDNDTTVGWFFDPKVPKKSKQLAKQYANRLNDDSTSIHQDFIHMAMGSTANLSIIPLQDLLGFGNDCRMNIPGTSTGNWSWRCAKRFLTPELAKWVHEQTHFFNRLPTKPPNIKNTKGTT